MSDILYDARERILAENQSILPTTPKDLKQTYEQQAAWAGFFAGAVAGGTIGAHIGLALGPLGAMAGTIPCAIIGGVIGAFGAAKAGAQFDQANEVRSGRYGKNIHSSRGIEDRSVQHRMMTSAVDSTPAKIEFCSTCNPEPGAWQEMSTNRCLTCGRCLFIARC